MRSLLVYKPLHEPVNRSTCQLKLARLKWVGHLVLIVMSGYQRHLEEFGNCFDPDHSGTEMMRFEFYDERRRRHYHEEVPACAECFGLK